MLVELLNDIMYKEENYKVTYLYKWAKEHKKDYKELWRQVQLLQDYLYFMGRKVESEEQLRSIQIEEQLNFFDKIPIDKTNKK